MAWFSYLTDGRVLARYCQYFSALLMEYSHREDEENFKEGVGRKQGMESCFIEGIFPSPTSSWGTFNG